MLRKLLKVLGPIVLGITIALLYVGAAQAASFISSYPPPESIKYQGNVVQQSRLYYYHWTYFSDTGEWVTIGPWKASRYDWPQADRVASGSRVNVVIRFKDRPDQLYVTRYGSVYANGGPRGGGTRVPVTLYPIKPVNPTPGDYVSKWGAYFKLPPGNHRIVIRTGYFPPTHGGPHSFGVETRLAHLKAY
jgi:hypothetical protein